MTATRLLKGAVHGLRRVALLSDGAGLLDAELLERYVRQRDEAAFEALVRRHGPMVLGVCRRVLGKEADAEDAFQATFLILVRKAGSVVPRALVGNWLYGVAHNTARKAKAMSSKRRAKEQCAGQARAATRPEERWGLLRAALDDELGRLPEKYRAPVVLCDLEGRTLREAARHLGWPQGTVAGRLARARALLAQRLSRHGLALAGTTMAAAVAQAAAPRGMAGALVGSTLQVAAALAAGSVGRAGRVSTKAITLMEGVLKDMLLRKLKLPVAALLVAALTAFGFWSLTTPQAPAQQASAYQAGNPPPAQAKEAGKAELTWQVRSTLEGHTDRVNSVAIARDGRRVATASQDGTVRLWDLTTGKTLAVLRGHEGAVNHVVFAPDGKHLATAGADKTARVWEIATGQEIQKVVHHDPVRCVAFAPDGKTLIAGGGMHEPDGDSRAELRLWDPATGKEQTTLAQGPTKGVHALVLSLDGKLLITATGNAFTIWQWDGKGQLKELHSARAQESAFVYGMALSPDDKTLAITWDAKVHLYDVASGQLRITLEKSHVGCWGPLVYSPDGTTVAASIIMQEEEGDWVVQRRTFLRTWDTATGKVRNTSMVPGAIKSMAFLPDGQSLVVGCRGGMRFRTLQGGIIDTRSIEEEKKDGSVKLLKLGAGPSNQK